LAVTRQSCWQPGLAGVCHVFRLLGPDSHPQTRCSLFWVGPLLSSLLTGRGLCPLPLHGL
jgi:hypothetical protein